MHSPQWLLFANWKNLRKVRYQLRANWEATPPANLYKQPHRVWSAYTFRFKTKLPEDLPPNAYDQVTNLSFGRIEFTATAKFGVVTGNRSGSEINATAAFEYIPHVYVGDPDDSFDYTQETYFPFPDRMVDGEDEHEHPHSLPKPAMGEMRELLKNEPKGKLRIMCKEPWFQMQTVAIVTSSFLSNLNRLTLFG